MLEQNSPYLNIFNYCNALSSNDKAGIIATKKDLKENIKPIIQQLLIIQEEMLTLKNKIEASFYPAPYLAELEYMNVMIKEKWLFIYKILLLVKKKFPAQPVI